MPKRRWMGDFVYFNQLDLGDNRQGKAEGDNFHVSLKGLKFICKRLGTGNWK